MLHGEHVDLRAIDLDDAEIVWRWLNDGQVMEGWGDVTSSPSLTNVRRRITRWLDDEERVGRPVAWTACLLDRSAVGLMVAEPVDGDPRALRLSLLIGDADDWGRGYGADVLDTLLDAAFDEWRVERVHLEVEAGNARALALYRKAGFRQEAVLRDARFRHGATEHLHVLAMTASDYAARRPAGSKAQSADERFDVVNASGDPTGVTKARWQVHRDGDWHRSLHLWIGGVHEGDAYLDFQRRGLEKDTWPGKLDATVAGHLGAGENVTQALREAEEEVGVTVARGEVHDAGVRVYAGEAGGRTLDRELQSIFLLRRDQPLHEYRLHPDEVDGMVRLALDDAIALLAGERADAPGTAITPGHAAAQAVTVHPHDFIPGVDRYFLRAALAMRRLLADEAHVLV
jgi:RimJ/RimL family protein N-acetyltransferase/isopentenyldiphosphate isomerase